MKFKAKRRSKTEAEIPAWLQPTDSRAKKKPNNPTPFELPGWLRESELRPEPRNTSPFSLEAEPHPCPAEGFIKELDNKLTLVSRQLDHIRLMHFRLVAELLRSGKLDQAALAWVDCSECRAELNALVDERQPAKKVH